MSQNFVRPDVALFLQFLNNQPGPKMHEIPVADARGMMLAMRHVAEADTGELAVIRDLAIPGPAGIIPARLYDARESRGPGPVMVFYHGGGFVIGDLETHEPYCAEAARLLDLPVIAIDYRLAPEHLFPAAPEDCEAATRWIATSPAELGLDVTGLIPSGDSAGGNLAIVTALALRDAPAAVPVIAMHPIYPCVSISNDWQSYRDFHTGFLLSEESMTWFGDAYQWDASDRRAAPIDFDAAGLPPTLLITAGLDPLRDQGRAYAGKLIAAGVPTIYREASGNIHGYINLRKALPSAQAEVVGALTALKAMIAELGA